MFCSNCGTQVNDGVQFCGNCGNSLALSNNIQDNNTQNTSTSNSTQQSNIMTMANLNINNRSNEYHYLEENRSVLKFFLLCFLTFGIYGLFFWSSYIKDLNIACNDNDDSHGYFKYLILSFITFNIYPFFWIYKQSNRLLDASNRIGANVKENGTTVLLWGIFTGGLAVPFFLIGNLNKVIKKLKTLN